MHPSCSPQVVPYLPDHHAALRVLLGSHGVDDLLEEVRRERLEERVRPEAGADRRLHIGHWALGSGHWALGSGNWAAGVQRLQALAHRVGPEAAQTSCTIRVRVHLCWCISMSSLASMHCCECWRSAIGAVLLALSGASSPPARLRPFRRRAACRRHPRHRRLSQR